MLEVRNDYRQEKKCSKSVVAFDEQRKQLEEHRGCRRAKRLRGVGIAGGHNSR